MQFKPYEISRYIFLIKTQKSFKFNNSRITALDKNINPDIAKTTKINFVV